MSVRASGVVPAVIRRGGSLDALSLAESRAAHGRWSPRDLCRRLRVMVHRLTRPVEQSCTIFTGQRMRVVLPEIVGADLYRRGYIEPALTRVLLEHLRPGMVFVDVGAHYGYHSLLASEAVGQRGCVVAFEPALHTFAVLVRNVSPLENVTAHQLAVHATPGTIDFHDFGRRNSALNTLLSTARVPPAERRQVRGRTYPVSCVSLDEFLRGLGLMPDVVKLDAEGSELSILRGMRRILTEGSPLVTVETGDYEGAMSPATAESIDFLNAHGYRCLEYANGLRPHVRRSTYGYDNVYFVKAT